MSLCYSFEKHININSLFEGYIDAVYVIHLEGNGRIESVRNQLQEYKLTRDVYIVYNKGYKKCNKPKNIISSSKDLIDVNKMIYRDALKKEYKTIMILEDDFIIHPDILSIHHVDNIKQFMNKKKNTKYIYYLGVLPYFSYPYDVNNYKCLACYTTHSVIYSDLMLQDILSREDVLDTYDHIDVFLVKEYMNKDLIYHYYKPLIKQLFPQTENRKEWENISPVFKFLTEWYIYLTNFEQRPEPGTSIFYLFSNFVCCVIILLCIMGVFVLYKYISNYYKLEYTPLFIFVFCIVFFLIGLHLKSNYPKEPKKIIQ